MVLDMIVSDVSCVPDYIIVFVNGCVQLGFMFLCLRHIYV